MDLLNKKSYYYDLPEELIAQTPLKERDQARLLVYHKDNKIIEHKHFYNILDYLKKGDVLVINNTKVLPARLYGYKETGAKIEVLLHKRIDLNNWECLAKPLKRLKVGDKVFFSEDFFCSLTEKLSDGICNMKFSYEGIFEQHLSEIGTMPLPPYIKEKLKDQNSYQTVYAKIEGSSAAPTAGLHFTNDLLKKIKEKGIEIVEVLLQVGLGTFRPVKEDNILKHDMHSEFFELTPENTEKLNKAKKEGRRIIAVGTTSVRVLESSCDENGIFSPQKRETSIFIYPPYKFKAIDGLITNFHLPESTLIMLVSAFIGRDETISVYNLAVKEKYRFFSFGDACLFI